MTLPNFLIIGAAKAGTTALYRNLEQHPQIYMSPVKEPAFFAVADQQLNVCGPQGNKLFTSLKAYEHLFHGVVNETAIGEASTVYLYSAVAPECIKQYVCNAKLIVVLRNPVDRAYAHFIHARREGFEPLSDFSQALQQEKKRIARRWRPLFHYRQMGFYYQQLKHYFDRFEREQIRVYLYEDYIANPASILKDVYRFLEVNETFLPDLSLRYNESGLPVNRTQYALYKFLRQQKQLKDLPFLQPFRKVFLQMKSQNFVKPQLSSSLRQELIQTYRNDILNLQKLIDKDLSNWLTS